MFKVNIILKEILTNLRLIWTVARYNNKAIFQGHYLGLAWEIMTPMIQIGLYFFVFGSMRSNADVYLNFNEREIAVGFLPWMLVGMSAWLFMKSATLQGSKSIQKQIKLVSKMQFPISVIPAIAVAGKLTAYFITVSIVTMIIMLLGYMPTLYWLQYFYYLFAMFVFIYFFALLNSTLTIMVRDYQQILQPIMQLLFWFSGVVWRIQEMVPARFVRVLNLNPFSYLLTGFRNTFFEVAFFWEHWETTAFFWLLVLLIALISSHLHLKLRDKFIDLA